MIEKVSLRPSPNQKFEILSIHLPEPLYTIPTLSEMGIYVQSNYECLIFGQKTEKFVFKFNADETITEVE